MGASALLLAIINSLYNDTVLFLDFRKVVEADDVLVHTLEGVWRGLMKHLTGILVDHANVGHGGLGAHFA